MKPRARPSRFFAYSRVSTKDQTGDGQKNTIEEYVKLKKIELVEHLHEIVSGTVPWEEREIATMVNERMRNGDTLIMTELSRLGRGLIDVTQMALILLKRRINLVEIKGATYDCDNNEDILKMNMLLYVAQKERSLISERTTGAVAAAVKLGHYPGKKPADPEILHFCAVRQKIPMMKIDFDAGYSFALIAEKYHIRRSSIVKYAKKHGWMRPVNLKAMRENNPDLVKSRKGSDA